MLYLQRKFDPGLWPYYLVHLSFLSTRPGSTRKSRGRPLLLLPSPSGDHPSVGGPYSFWVVGLPSEERFVAQWMQHATPPHFSPSYHNLLAVACTGGYPLELLLVTFVVTLGRR